MTYGDKINQLAKEYISYYNSSKDDPTHPFHDKAASMALLDLEMQIFVAEQAIKKVKQHILENPVKEN